MKKLLYISLCLLQFQIEEIKASREIIFSDFIKELMIVVKLVDLSNTIPNFESRFGKINSVLQEKYLFQISSDNDLNTLEALHKNREFYASCSIVSFAILPMLGFFTGSTIGEMIGKYYDDQESNKEKPHLYKEEYEQNGSAIGATAGIISFLILTAYLTQTPNSLTDFKIA